MNTLLSHKEYQAKFNNARKEYLFDGQIEKILKRVKRYPKIYKEIAENHREVLTVDNPEEFVETITDISHYESFQISEFWMRDSNGYRYFLKDA